MRSDGCDYKLVVVVVVVVLLIVVVVVMCDLRFVDVFSEQWRDCCVVAMHRNVIESEKKMW
jgi:hypothetical protein